MTIVQKILGGFGLIILLMVFVGLGNSLAVRSMQQQSDEIVTGLQLDGELTQREVDHLIWADRVRDFIEDEQAVRLEVETDYRRCGFGLWYYGEGRRQAEQLVPSLAPLLARIEQPHRELHETAVAIEQAADRREAARIYARQSVPALQGVQGLLGEIRAETTDEVRSREETARTTMRTSSRVVAGSLALAALFAGAIGFLTYRGLTSVMGNVGRELAEGANQVAAAANEVSSSSQSLAEGSTEQAASVEEISASLEEVTSMTQQDADNIRQANSLMDEAGRVISGAEASMQRLVTSMQEISRASAETQKIVQTIDEIAFQTNLLALNAAVEAARAGEAGAGFAVVADEVRNLAMRAAEAAKNTSSLIDGTVGKIQSGSSLVDETSGSFKTTTESIGKISTLIREIAESSAEQSKAVAQVNSAVLEIDTVIQRTAATAEESASASEQLSAQSAVLQEMVRRMIRAIGGIDESIFAVDAAPGGQLKRPPTGGGSGRAASRPTARRALPGPVGKKTAAGAGAAGLAGSSKAAGEGNRPAKKKNIDEIFPLDDDDFEDF
ncbi:methyl-accepting chemotaxis protein [Desulfurivibrio alkaliphilus]|uniref:Methyl-accepting chemotaxis sensory transducer n=1 Tax=Desulfurivibrio alkaliphilus (strain DSM 19089 / UNIQEM U267 / AHT2) TaxID=589865 RepID=D6Z479_DESAT|nr:methyl-accepting chemotaxis protein [Desulfurivibrio alkaliphilus]ADH86354.1 methyl-accepting chemotaxis sensory transducer [Desulfurivibrio alkaliphilus AHT 2]